MSFSNRREQSSEAELLRTYSSGEHLQSERYHYRNYTSYASPPDNLEYKHTAAVRDPYSILPLPSPISAANSPQERGPTSLPSFRELVPEEAFQPYLPSPPMDQSSLPHPISTTSGYPLRNENGPPRSHSSFNNPKVYQMQAHVHARTSTPMAYDYQYIHGQHEPFLPQPYYEQPLHLNVNPYDIYRPRQEVEKTINTNSSVLSSRSSPRKEEQATHKRFRRRAEEVARHYMCNWPGCDRGYGALNHLNTHVANAGHGPKREPHEFAEIRKQLKEEERQSREATLNQITRVPVPHFNPYHQRSRHRRKVHSLPLPQVHYSSPPPHLEFSANQIPQRHYTPPAYGHHPYSQSYSNKMTNLERRHPQFVEKLRDPHYQREYTASPPQSDFYWNDERVFEYDPSIYFKSPTSEKPRDGNEGALEQ